MSETKPYSVRLSSELRGELQEEAASLGRSLHQHILLILSNRTSPEDNDMSALKKSIKSREEMIIQRLKELETSLQDLEKVMNQSINKD